MTILEPIDQRDRTAAGPLQRRVNRRRALLKGLLVFGEAHSTILVPIRDLSDFGARLKLAPYMPLPREFFLVQSRDCIVYRAAIAWRSRDRVGLRFIGRLDLSQPNLTSIGKVLRELWIELQPREQADYKAIRSPSPLI